MAGRAKKPIGKNPKTINDSIFDVERGEVLRESLEHFFSHHKELTRTDFCCVLGVSEEQLRKYERGKDTIPPGKLMRARRFFLRYGGASLADEFIRRMREVEDELMMAIYTNDATETLKDSEGVTLKDSERRGSQAGYFLLSLRMYHGRGKIWSYEDFSAHLEKNRAEQEQKNRKSSQRITPEQLRALAEINEDELTKKERDLLIKIIRFSGVPLKEWRYVFADDVIDLSDP